MEANVLPCPPETLQGLPLFSRLSEPTRRAIAERTGLRRYRRHAFIITEGEPAEAFHFLVEGRVRVFRDTPGGSEQTLQVLERGGLLALISLLDAARYPASAQAMLDSVVGVLRRADLVWLGQHHGDFAWALLQQVTRRLVWSQGRIYDLALRTATGRVVSALVQYAQEHGQLLPDGRMAVSLPFTHREIGELTGVSRETVTRTFSLLRDTGGLRWGEDGRLILDPHVLRPWLHV